MSAAEELYDDHSFIPVEPGILFEPEVPVHLELVPELEETATVERGRLRRSAEWIRRNNFKLALGISAVSTSIMLTTDPLENTKHQLLEAAPEVIKGLTVTEGMFIGGLVMMIGAVGDKIGNPFTLKRRVKQMASKANDSLLFKSGLAINTVGAVGSAAVFTAGVVAELPPSSWGVLSLALIDLSATVAVRNGIYNGIRNNAESPE